MAIWKMTNNSRAQCLVKHIVLRNKEIIKIMSYALNHSFEGKENDSNPCLSEISDLMTFQLEYSYRDEKKNHCSVLIPF